MTARGAVLLAALVGSIASAGCDLFGKKPSGSSGPGDPPVVSVTTASVPPASSLDASPASQLADTSTSDVQSPFEQAKVYESNGQLWMARLVLETKALGPDATRDETELLARICAHQGDSSCVEKCGRKLGRKIKVDAGAPGSSSSASGVGGEHHEPDTDLARARDLLLKHKLEPARKVLEPKVLDGKASREEVQMLRTICEKQGDRMCVALCNTTLR